MTDDLFFTPIQFSIVLILIILLEIAAAISAIILIAQLDTTLEEEITEGLQTTIGDYRASADDPDYSEDDNNVIDNLQEGVSRLRQLGLYILRKSLRRSYTNLKCKPMHAGRVFV